MKNLLILAIFVSALTVVAFVGTKKMAETKITYSHFNHLSVAAKNSLKETETEFRMNANRQCLEICRKRFEVLTMLGEPAPDKQAIEKKIEEIGAMQTDLEKTTASHILEIKKTLSPQDAQMYLENIRKELNESMKQMGM